MKRRLIALTGAALFLISFSGLASERPELEFRLQYSDFAPYQHQLTRAEVEARIARYLMKTPGSDLSQYYSVSDQAFSLYESPAKKAKGLPEFTLELREGDPTDRPVRASLGSWKPSQDSAKPLKGLKIALDPGHLGGDIAGYLRPEDRYVWIRDSGAQFNEGTLTFLTAKRLEALLTADGAEVLLTREAIGEGAEGIPYAYWFSAYFKADLEEYLLTNFQTDAERAKARTGILDPANAGGPFKVLSWRDLKLRSQKINAFVPDLTLVMHYNAGAPAKDESGRDVGVKDDLLMTFVPGSFMNGELADQPSRYHFMRLIATDDLRESQAFSREVVGQLARVLHVKIAPTDYPASYLVNGSMLLEPGVYSRNLGLTRLTKGRLCYAEPLFQDNLDESVRLARKDTIIDGVPTSSRLLEAAEAYYEAIREMARRAR